MFVITVAALFRFQDALRTARWSAGPLRTQRILRWQQGRLRCGIHVRSGWHHQQQRGMWLPRERQAFIHAVHIRLLCCGLAVQDFSDRCQHHTSSNLLPWKQLLLYARQRMREHVQRHALDGPAGWSRDGQVCHANCKRRQNGQSRRLVVCGRQLRARPVRVAVRGVRCGLFAAFKHCEQKLDGSCRHQ